MTTLDDAAERRKRIDEIGRSWGLVENNMIEVSILEAMHECWKAATEAAAKKCEATRIDIGVSARVIEIHNDACDDCAAAIRGANK